MNSNISSNIQLKSDLKVVEFDLENPNLFDLPLSHSNQMGGSSDMDLGFDDILRQDIHKEVQINQKLNSIRDYELGNLEEHDLIGGSSDAFNQNGGYEDPQLFDQIVKKDNSVHSSSNLNSSSSSSSILEKHLEENPPTLQQGGFNLNVEGIDIEDLTDTLDDTENPGNYETQNPGEDLPNTDDDRFDQTQEQQQEPQRWVHPELTIENDNEMIIKMSQEDINSKVNLYLENYNSNEYQSYIKYFNAIYNASTQKYTIRRDNESNIYLIKRQHSEKDKEGKDKDLRGKKTKESIYEVLDSIKNKEYMTDYLIKLTPPKYLNIQDELKTVTRELNILSGEIKILQNDLIELGSEITNEDVKKFERLREKFYKLINKKYIYSKYYDEVNELFDTEIKQNIYAKEIISQIDENDVKFYKLKYHIIKAPETLINNITNEIKNNLENYTSIINDTNTTDKKKEYIEKIKNFINVKKESENKIQTELNNIILNSKNKIDYIVKKLPKLDIKTDIL